MKLFIKFWGKSPNLNFEKWLKHGASLYLKFEGLNLSVVIIFKTFHWLKNFESCSIVSVTRRQCCFASEKRFYVVVRRPFQLLQS